MADEQNEWQEPLPENTEKWEIEEGVGEEPLSPDAVDEIVGDSEGVDALIREAREMHDSMEHDRRGAEAAQQRYETQFHYVYPKRFDDPKGPKGEVTGEVRAVDGTVLRRMTDAEVERLLRETEGHGEEGRGTGGGGAGGIEELGQR